jgi:hypothetical protein
LTCLRVNSYEIDHVRLLKSAGTDVAGEEDEGKGEKYAHG